MAVGGFRSFHVLVTTMLMFSSHNLNLCLLIWSPAGQAV